MLGTQEILYFQSVLSVIPGGHTFQGLRVTWLVDCDGFKKLKIGHDSLVIIDT